ncbi:hypothetical protein MNBD_DELTA02-699, partial [hydrothermal vent metagenome]
PLAVFRVGSLYGVIFALAFEQGRQVALL